jgi:hypothetical protein
MSPPLVEVGGMEAGIATVVTYLSVNIHAPNSEPGHETVLKGRFARLMLRNNDTVIVKVKFTLMRDLLVPFKVPYLPDII